LTELLKQIDKMADDYLSKVRSMAGEQRKEQLNNIQKLFNQSKKFGDEKVQLALQTYEMVRAFVLFVLWCRNWMCIIFRVCSLGDTLEKKK